MEKLLQLKKDLEEHIKQGDQGQLVRIVNKHFTQGQSEEVNNRLGGLINLSKYYLEYFNEYKVFPAVLNSTVMELPKQRQNNIDYFDFISQIFDDYQQLLNEMEQSFNFSLNNIETINEVCNSIKQVILSYYSGKPSEAYQAIEQLLSNILPHLQMFLKNKAPIPNYLYRMRKTDGVNSAYESGQMYHIPFDKRHLITTQRYSIPGLPCLYMGSSSYVCWEELQRPILENTQTAILQTNQNRIKFLDFGVRPFDFSESIIENIKQRINASLTSDELEELKNYLICWPIIAACSIKVNYQDAAFKPEYILPQLILQWIINNPEYDGIRYFSVKEDCQRSSLTLIHNYVFPVQSNHITKGHCEVLKEKFSISQGVPWQLYKIHPFNSIAISNGFLTLMENVDSLSYDQTDFGKIEGYLYENHLSEALFHYSGTANSDLISQKPNFLIDNKSKIEESFYKSFEIYSKIQSPDKIKVRNYIIEIFNNEFHISFNGISKHPFNGTEQYILQEFSRALNVEMGLDYGKSLLEFKNNLER
jgi:hypothetical protein